MITPLLPPPQHINLEQHCYPNANMSTFIVTNTPATYAADDTHPELTSSLAVQFEGIMSRRLRQSFLKMVAVRKASAIAKAYVFSDSLNATHKRLKKISKY